MSGSVGFGKAELLVETNRIGQIRRRLELDPSESVGARCGHQLLEHRAAESPAPHRGTEIHLPQFGGLGGQWIDAATADDDARFIDEDTKDAAVMLIRGCDVI